MDQTPACHWAFSYFLPKLRIKYVRDSAVQGVYFYNQANLLENNPRVKAPINVTFGAHDLSTALQQTNEPPVCCIS